MRFFLRKIRTFFWTFQSLYGRHNKLILGGFILGVSLVLLLWKIYPFYKNLLPRSKKIIAVVGLYETTDLPLAIQKKISFGLTDISVNGSAVPSAATSWKTDQDGKRYFFDLRKDILWHDGESFTAYDVNYNFKDVFINAADKNTLKIELEEQFSPLPTLLSKPLFKKGLVGLGEYKVVYLRLKENKVERLLLKPADQESTESQLEYRFYPDTKTAVIAFKLGEADVLEGMFLTNYLHEDNSTKVSSEPINNLILTVFFNLKNELFKEKEVRQALSYATPNFEGKVLDSPIADSSWGYNGQIKQYKFNLDFAKNLLEKDKKTASLSAELSLFTFPEYLREAEKIADNWESLGFKTAVRVTHVLPSEFDAYLGILEIPPDPDQYSLWHSTQERSNLTSYQNPKIDKLLEDGRKTTDIEERVKIYREFQRYLAEDAPAKFIVQPLMYTASRK